MRILIATGVYPPEIGGPATAMLLFVKKLRSEGHDVHVLTYGEMREEENVIAIPRVGNVLQRYRRFAAIARKQLKECDVVIATDVFSVGIPVRFALLFKKTRFILRLGGEFAWEDAVNKKRTQKPLKLFWKEDSVGWRMKCIRWNYLWILKRAEIICVTSDWLKTILMDEFPECTEKYVTVWQDEAPHPAVSSDIINAKPHTPLRFVYIGRFAPVKNVITVAYALKAVSERGIDIECVFVGMGETMNECKNILHNVKGIYFMGNVDQDALPAILSESDILLLPSLSDICPNAVVEALSYGVPVLMTIEHGLPRPVLGAMELDPLNVGVWTEKIIELATNTIAYVELRNMVVPIEFPITRKLVEIANVSFPIK